MSKFGNKKVLVDGIWFDSKKEAKRYQDLKLLQAAKLIRNLMLQQVFDLAHSVVIQGRKRPPLRYKADFTYFDDRQQGAFVVEDCKGFKTEGYKIKRHLMKSVHGIDILES
jgi:hypothetical protein